MSQKIKSQMKFTFNIYLLVAITIVFLLSLSTTVQCEELPQPKSLTIESGILHWKEKKLDNGNVLLSNIWLFRTRVNQWVRVIGPWGAVENFNCLKGPVTGGDLPSPEKCGFSLYESQLQALRLCRFADFNFSQDVDRSHLSRYGVVILSETGAIAGLGLEFNTLNDSQLESVECTNNPTPPNL